MIVGVDADATENTVYDLGIDIEVQGDNLEVTVVLSNEDNNFGYITTWDIYSANY